MKSRLFKTASLLMLIPLVFSLLVSSAFALSITASTGIAMDYDTGEILFAKDIDTLRVPASMTKIMTAYIVYEELARGNLAKDTMVPVSDTAAAMSRNSAYPMAVPLQSGGSYSIDTLLQLIMVPSASASCYVLAEYISGTEEAFVARMNDTAARMGIQAQYQNCHGALPHYITGRGVAVLIRNFIIQYPDILNYTSLTSIYFNGVTYANTNRLLTADYYYEGADGFKTGTIAAAGYCLSATAVRDGRRVITVVMNSSSTNTRHTDSRALLDYGFAELSRRDASKAATYLESVSVPGEIRLGADFEIRVRALGVSAEFEAEDAYFSIGGKVIKSFGVTTVTDGKEFSLSACLDAYEGEEAEVKFVLKPYGAAAKEISLSVPISEQAPAFYRDINGHWAESAITEMSEAGVFEGDGSGYFRPEDTVTRAMFVTTLGRFAESLGIGTVTEGGAVFSDVPAGEWYSKYVAWAYESGIVEGYGDTFGPKDLIEREQAATLIYRFLDVYGYELDQNKAPQFTDEGSISEWAAEAVAYIAGAGVIEGYPNGSFGPANVLSRAESAVILGKLMNLL